MMKGTLMVSLDTKLTKLLRELIQHEVNVITDSDWFQDKVDEAVDNKFLHIIKEGHLLKEKDSPEWFLEFQEQLIKEIGDNVAKDG